MVKKTEANGKKLYQCEECGFHYFTLEKAEECEKWCAENRSCNLKIVKHAVESQN